MFDKTSISFHVDKNFLSTLNITLCMLAKIGCQDLCLKTITTENKVAIFKGLH